MSKRTERKPKAEPAANQGSTWGVRILPNRTGRPNPFGVQWPEKIWNAATNQLERKVKTLFYPTAESRDRKAAEQIELRRAGMMTESVSRAELADFRAFKSATEGTPWQNVVAGWRTHLMASGVSVCALTVSKSVEEYLLLMKSRMKAEKLSADNFRHKDHKLNLFAGQFGDRMLDQPTAQEIELWIDSFEEVESDITFDNYRKHVSALYGHYRKAKAIAVNPCEQIETRGDPGEVHIITVAQTAQLFQTALTWRDAQNKLRFLPAIGRLASEFFVGLRFGSACRLSKEDVKREDKGVELPKRKLKTKRRHYIDGLPDNFWAWIDITPDECWDLTAREYLELKSDLFRVAGVPHPKNCARHGFATYHLAAFKNPGLTATILCHKDQDLLWEVYNGQATEANGKLYQTITPATAKRLAMGFVPSSTQRGGREQATA